MTGKPYKLFMLTAAALLLVVAGFLQQRLNRQRTELGLTRVAPLENAPPVLAFTTVALGGFRGLIANALWVRANDLQMEDKYFEQVQLADWITKLEPTFVHVWLVQAWNMAYNISVKFRDPYDRWRWVQRGIELLRDQGLQYNPKEALLYRELAWFYQHKIGQNLDDAHLVYKYELARQMTRVLGGGRPNYDELLNPQTPEARQRVELLQEKLKMDPAMMKKADDLYGPMEWRLPEATAIYWAMVGLEKSNKKELIALRRVIYQSLHMNVMRGRIVAENPDGSYTFGPDLSKIAMANDGYSRMLAEETDKKIVVERAHKNFLREAVYLLYTHNRLSEADQWMKTLREKYPDAIEKNVTVEQYALARMIGSIKDLNHNRTKAVIEGLVSQYFLNLALDNDDRADGLLRMAQQVWQFYTAETASRQEVLKLEPMEKIVLRFRDMAINPENGFRPEYAARIRTKLNLPPPPATTNSPTAAPAVPLK
ncbi:MAG: hypothetical protein IPK15_08065 [Verrucomicrobia bacterium]|nr:hypothetical protein [Verrucomicrobiota bacterium]